MLGYRTSADGENVYEIITLREESDAINMQELRQQGI